MNKNRYCINCGEKLNLLAYYFKTKRCKSCANKFHKHNYIDGRSLKKYYCECGNEISSVTGRFGKGMCKSCSVSGANNPRFNNWSSLDPYTIEFNEIIKSEIRIRDNFKCRLCHKTEEQELKDYRRSLTIHHIDYNKQNCEKDNLISLCNQCHLKTNSNRDYYYAYFTYLIKEITQCLIP